MALNTPKRIKIFNSLIQSPSSDYNSEWQNEDDDDESVNKSASTVTNQCNARSIGVGIPNGSSLSPASSCDSPEFPLRNSSNNSSNISASSTCNAINTYDSRENRRGRPRSEALTTLMIEGSTSPSSIKCSYCNRVFPREKSLQAHLRTHTGERPYACDYPGCTRAFTQSGQLKTHQRLHTGERPFMCVRPHCQMRFTHANRHCPEHPYDQLKRCDDFVIQAVTEQNFEVIKWLEKYKMEKEDRTPTRKTPKRTKPSLSDDVAIRRTNLRDKSNENFNIGRRSSGNDENKFPVTPSNPYKSRKGLMVELDMNAGLGASPITGTKMKPTPKVIHWQEPLSQEEDSADEFEMPAQSTFNPKKRWLREAWQNDLAKPLEPNITNNTLHLGMQKSYSDFNYSPTNQISSPSKRAVQPVQTPVNVFDNNQMNPNQLRPTVLMVAANNRTMPLANISTTKKNEESQFNIHEQSQQQIEELSTSKHIANFPSSPAIYNVTKRNESIIDIRIGRNDVIASTPRTPSHRNHNDTKVNRKSQQWLGALALMELATDENSLVSLSS